MRAETNCRIEIETSVRDARDRVVTVNGPVPKLPVLLTNIAERLGNAAKGSHGGDKKREDDAVITLLVDNNVAGGLIGKGGSKITETRRTSGANIRISSQPLEGSSEKTVQIRGDSKRVNRALEIMIYQILAEPDKNVRRPLKHKVEYDDFRGPPPAFYDRRDAWGREGPYGPPRMRAPPGRGPYGPPAGPYGPPPRGPPPAAIYGAPPPYAPRPPRFEGPTVSVTIPVADHLVGGIIGRGGYKINDIRQRSGAQIKVSPLEPGSSERKIVVSGPQQACDLASSMINERIKEQQDDRALQQ